MMWKWRIRASAMGMLLWSNMERCIWNHLQAGKRKRGNGEGCKRLLRMLSRGTSRALAYAYLAQLPQQRILRLREGSLKLLSMVMATLAPRKSKR